jgi:hypothetical protein
MIRVIMLPFCESAKMAALPLPETTAHALTSLTSPFYKSHSLPRLGAAPSFPRPAFLQFGPAIKLCSMDTGLFSWAFFVSGVFPNNQDKENYPSWDWPKKTKCKVRSCIPMSWKGLEVSIVETCIKYGLQAVMMYLYYFITFSKYTTLM